MYLIIASFGYKFFCIQPIVWDWDVAVPKEVQHHPEVLRISVYKHATIYKSLGYPAVQHCLQHGPFDIAQGCSACSEELPAHIQLHYVGNILRKQLRPRLF